MELEIIVSIINETLKLKGLSKPITITEDTNIVRDLAADSLEIAEIIIKIEEKFDIDLSDIRTDEILTVRDLLNVIKNA